MGAVNCDKSSAKKLCGQLGISGFPTLKVSCSPGWVGGVPLNCSPGGGGGGWPSLQPLDSVFATAAKHESSQGLFARPWRDGPPGPSRATRPPAFLATHLPAPCPLPTPLPVCPPT